jgi:hypothetical protein
MYWFSILGFQEQANMLYLATSMRSHHLYRVHSNARDICVLRSIQQTGLERRVTGPFAVLWGTTRSGNSQRHGRGSTFDIAQVL